MVVIVTKIYRYIDICKDFCYYSQNCGAERLVILSNLYIDPLKKKNGREFLNRTTHKVHLKKKIGSQLVSKSNHT